jgi:hypothetical protein
MCQVCDQQRLQRSLSGTRRDLLKLSGAAGLATAIGIFKPGQAQAQSNLPAGVGTEGQRTLIRGGAVMSMDPQIGELARGDVLINGRRIEAIGVDLDAPDAAVIEANGMIVLPGFIDTHHHQFQTALRSVLADGILVNDGRPENAMNYYNTILQTADLYATL